MSTPVVVFYTKSPPQVVTEVTHTGFPIWRVKRPHDGFFILNSSFDHAFENQRFRPLLLNCVFILA